MTNNVLGHFTKILQQRSNRRGGVAQQVLQTLSILLQNVRHQQTVYCLFSNNHLNDIVTMHLDFEDDEVLVSWMGSCSEQVCTLYVADDFLVDIDRYI